MADDFLPKCNVCLLDYSDKRIPLNLTCGHSVCSSCADHILDSTTCPECRQGFTAENREDLSINHAVLTLSRINSWAKMDTEETHPISLTFTHLAEEPLRSVGKCPEHGHSQFFLCLPCVALLCRSCVAENHPDPPRGHCSIVDFQKGMDRIKRSHLNAFESYIKESGNAMERLRNALRGLDLVIHHLKKNECNVGNQSYQMSELEFTKEKEICNSRITKLKAHTNRLKRVEKNIQEAKSLEILKGLIEGYGKIEKTFKTFMADEEARSLRWLKKMLVPFYLDAVKCLEDSMPLYAIQELDGKSSWAEVMSKDNKILLYSLQDGKPPKHGVCVPFELLRTLVPRESPTVFMEFGDDGEYMGRFYIQMFGDTARGCQAVLLCSGERGPSYRRTKFYPPYFSNDDNDCINGGDYENNDGSGGKAIVDDIDDDKIYEKRIEPGVMFGWPAMEHFRLGNFRLHTWDRSWLIEELAFGKVVENLEVVTEQLYNDKEVYFDPRVMDCGLVLIK